MLVPIFSIYYLFVSRSSLCSLNDDDGSLRGLRQAISFTLLTSCVCLSNSHCSHSNLPTMNKRNAPLENQTTSSRVLNLYRARFHSSFGIHYIGVDCLGRMSQWMKYLVRALCHSVSVGSVLNSSMCATVDVISLAPIVRKSSCKCRVQIYIPAIFCIDQRSYIYLTH